MEQPRKIGVVTTTSIIALAILFDVISLIPIINIFSGLTAWLIFSTWFYLLGFGLFNSRRIATTGLSLLAEIIPFISSLPTITTGVVYIIFTINHPLINTATKKLDSSFLKRRSIPDHKSSSNYPNNSRVKFSEQSDTSRTQTLKTKDLGLNDLIPIRTVQPQNPGYAKLPDQTNVSLPQRRRLPPDINPAAPYGEEDEWDDLQKTG